MVRACMLVALLTAGCNAAPTSPTPAPLPVRGTPAHIDLTAQPGLNANGGTATVTARVSDAFSALLPDVAVSFSATAGSFSTTPVATDANGIARAVLTAPSGSVQVTAHAGSIETAPVLVAIQPTVAPPTPTPSPMPPDPNAPPGSLAVTLSAAVAELGSISVFNALVTNPSAGPPSFTWSFGDGQASVSLSPSTAHTYAAIGTYAASVSVRDSAGRSASASTTATVIAVIPPPPPPPPVQSYAVVLTASPASVQTNVATTLTATVTPVNGAPAASTFAWDCGNGATVTNGSATQTCNYNAAGTMNARVTVSNGTIVGFGATTVTVTAAPVQSYTVTIAATPSSVTAGGSSSLIATVTAINGAPASPSIAFDCGGNGAVNPAPSTSTAATCTYTTVGSVTARATATSGAATGSGTTPITVTTPPAPTISVNCNTNGKISAPAVATTCVVQSATVNGTPVAVSAIGPVTWEWGDGQSNIDAAGNVSPSHTYANPLTYTVTARAVVVGASGRVVGTANVTIAP